MYLDTQVTVVSQDAAEWGGGGWGGERILSIRHVFNNTVTDEHLKVGLNKPSGSGSP